MSTGIQEPELDLEKLGVAPPRKSLNQRWTEPRFRRALIGAAAALVILAVAVAYYYHHRVTTDDAQVDGHIIAVSSKIYGDIAQVLIDDNQPVKQGQVLVRIDARDYQVKVAQARAALAVAESQARAAEVGVPLTRETTQSGTSGAQAQLAAAEAEYQRAQENYQLALTADLAYAEANVAAREAANEKAQADLARMKPLIAKDEISNLQFDSYRAAARVADSELKAAQEKLVAARRDSELRRSTMLAAESRRNQTRAALAAAIAAHKQVDIQSAQAASAAATVQQARANLEAAELQLSYTQIVAPVDGVVTRKRVETGQIVQPGQGLLVLIPLNDIWVTANFKETQLAKVRAGQKAEVSVDMYGHSFPGKVDSVAGATGTRLSLLPPENATGNYVKVVQRIPVKILLDPIPPDKAVLRPGMNVVATIKLY